VHAVQSPYVECNVVKLKKYTNLIKFVSFQYIRCLMAINLHCLLAFLSSASKNRAKCLHDIDFPCMDIFTVFGMSILINPKVVEYNVSKCMPLHQSPYLVNLVGKLMASARLLPPPMSFFLRPKRIFFILIPDVNDCLPAFFSTYFK
jgi:hypothetical protein